MFGLALGFAVDLLVSVSWSFSWSNIFSVSWAFGQSEKGPVLVLMVHLESAGSTGNLLRTFESLIKGQWKKGPVLAKFESFYIPPFFLYSNFFWFWLIYTWIDGLEPKVKRSVRQKNGWTD